MDFGCFNIKSDFFPLLALQFNMFIWVWKAITYFSSGLSGESFQIHLGYEAWWV